MIFVNFMMQKLFLALLASVRFHLRRTGNFPLRHLFLPLRCMRRGKQVLFKAFTHYVFVFWLLT